MNQAAIIQCIEQVAPLTIAAAWDHSGIQLPFVRPEIHCLGVCLDPTPTAVAQALEAGAEFILAHHPLSLEPRFPKSLDAYHAVLSLLFKAEVPLYSAHTSLDANPHGPVTWLADVFGLSSLEVLEETGRMTDGSQTWPCGFGFVGQTAQPLSPERLEALLAPFCSSFGGRLVGTLPKSLQRIAVCPGSGGSLAAAAADKGAQLLVTGDIKYHPALEFPLPVLDMGHFCLEEEMMRRFSHSLEKCLTDVRVVFIAGQDPFKPFFTTH